MLDSSPNYTEIARLLDEAGISFPQSGTMGNGKPVRYQNQDPQRQGTIITWSNKFEVPTEKRDVANQALSALRSAELPVHIDSRTDGTNRMSLALNEAQLQKLDRAMALAQQQKLSAAAGAPGMSIPQNKTRRPQSWERTDSEVVRYAFKSGMPTVQRQDARVTLSYADANDFETARRNLDEVADFSFSTERTADIHKGTITFDFKGDTDRAALFEGKLQEQRQRLHKSKLNSLAEECSRKGLIEEKNNPQAKTILFQVMDKTTAIAARDSLPKGDWSVGIMSDGKGGSQVWIQFNSPDDMKLFTDAFQANQEIQRQRIAEAARKEPEMAATRKASEPENPEPKQREPLNPQQLGAISETVAKFNVQSSAVDDRAIYITFDQNVAKDVQAILRQNKVGFIIDSATDTRQIGIHCVSSEEAQALKQQIDASVEAAKKSSHSATHPLPPIPPGYAEAGPSSLASAFGNRDRVLRRAPDKPQNWQAQDNREVSMVRRLGAQECSSQGPMVTLKCSSPEAAERLKSTLDERYNPSSCTISRDPDSNIVSINFIGDNERAQNFSQEFGNQQNLQHDADVRRLAELAHKSGITFKDAKDRTSFKTANSFTSDYMQTADFDRLSENREFKEYCEKAGCKTEPLFRGENPTSKRFNFQFENPEDLTKFNEHYQELEQQAQQEQKQRHSAEIPSDLAAKVIAKAGVSKCEQEGDKLRLTVSGPLSANQVTSIMRENYFTIQPEITRNQHYIVVSAESPERLQALREQIDSGLSTQHKMSPSSSAVNSPAPLRTPSPPPQPSTPAINPQTQKYLNNVAQIACHGTIERNNPFNNVQLKITNLPPGETQVLASYASLPGIQRISIKDNNAIITFTTPELRENFLKNHVDPIQQQQAQRATEPHPLPRTPDSPPPKKSIVEDLILKGHVVGCEIDSKDDKIVKININSENTREAAFNLLRDDDYNFKKGIKTDDRNELEITFGSPEQAQQFASELNQGLAKRQEMEAADKSTPKNASHTSPSTPTSKDRDPSQPPPVPKRYDEDVVSLKEDLQKLKSQASGSLGSFNKSNGSLRHTAQRVETEDVTQEQTEDYVDNKGFNRGPG